MCGFLIIRREMSKFLKRFELYVLLAAMPAIGVAATYATFKAFIWSFGGRECFRYAVIKEPQEKDWVRANPRDVLGRDAPLSRVPDYLETPGHGEVGAAHDHHNNF